MKLIIGAKNTRFPGWESTDIAGGFDARDFSHWRERFEPNSLEAITTEHMLEHMTENDCRQTLNNCYVFLSPRGRLRVATPDAFNPNPYYQEHSRPGGTGQALMSLFMYAPDEPAHMVHYNIYSLTRQLIDAGFQKVQPLEYFDESGYFNKSIFHAEDGPIRRHKGSQFNEYFYKPVYGFENLSLIIDAYKLNS